MSVGDSASACASELSPKGEQTSDASADKHISSAQRPVSGLICRTSQAVGWLLTYDFCPWANRFVYWVREPIGFLGVAGLVALCCAMFLSAFAWMAVAGVAVVLVLGTIWPWVALRGLEARLTWESPRAREGESAQVRLTMRNRCPWPVWGITVRGGFREDGASTALARVGGLRTPSEPFALKWGDILWDEDKIVVHSPKTEHHEGGDCRIIPLFPELKPYLEKCFDEAEEGSECVVEGLKKGCRNLGPQFRKIVKKAGLKPWPKIFHNLRASRETELADEFPIQVVCDWIGHDPQIAARHYLTITDEHFKKAMQNPMQQPAEMGSKELNKSISPKEKPPEFPGVSSICKPLQQTDMDDTGLEPVTSTMSTHCCIGQISVKPHKNYSFGR